MLTKYWQNLKKLALDILFPPICLVCEHPLEENETLRHVCARCFDRIVINDTLFCAVCKARQPENTKICHFDIVVRLAAATSYDEPAIKKLLWQFKYECLDAAATPLLEIFIKYLSRLDYDLGGYSIVPIPLHPRRLRQRGFNQAEIFGDAAATALKIPILKNILARMRHTKPQMEMRDADSRAANIIGSFVVAEKSVSEIAGKNLIIVDDVFTSGATTFEAARILRSAGAKKIIILALAKGR